MKNRTTRRGPGTSIQAQQGITILEVVLAIAILTVVISGLLGLFAFAVGMNKSQGEIATRTTEYCQDKMEQLMALSFNDGSTDTTQYPPASTGGTGLGGTMAASATVGGINVASPVTGYVDYLDASGNLLTSSTGAFYKRLWTISTDSTAKLKTITVLGTDATAAGSRGKVPSTSLVSIKATLQ
jgi:hypothetical protein